jgi:hypothetical protein
MPFLVRLCHFLPGQDLQRAAAVFHWNSLQNTHIYKACMKQIWAGQRKFDFNRNYTNSQRFFKGAKGFPMNYHREPRKHRDYFTKCYNCEKLARSRRCCVCKRNWVCDSCDPFDLETRYAYAYCSSCLDDHGF